MKNRDVEELLSKMEKISSDDLNLFLEIGGSCYSLMELEQLKFYWESAFEKYKTYHSMCLVTTIGSLILIPLSLIFTVSGLGELFLPTFIAFIVLFIGGGVSFSLLNFRFGSISKFRFIGEQIDQSILRKQRGNRKGDFGYHSI